MPLRTSTTPRATSNALPARAKPAPWTTSRTITRASPTNCSKVTDNPAYDGNHGVDMRQPVKYRQLPLRQGGQPHQRQTRGNRNHRMERIRQSGQGYPYLRQYQARSGIYVRSRRPPHRQKTIPKADLPIKTEYYVHDATGNVLSIYTHTEAHDETDATYKVNERVGVRQFAPGVHGNRFRLVCLHSGFAAIHTLPAAKNGTSSATIWATYSRWFPTAKTAFVTMAYSSTTRPTYGTPTTTIPSVC